MDNKSKTFLAALGGAAIGAGIALLFAPASGKETRQNIADKAKETGQNIADKTNEVAGKVKESIHNKKEQLVEKGREILSDVKA